MMTVLSTMPIVIPRSDSYPYSSYVYAGRCTGGRREDGPSSSLMASSRRSPVLDLYHPITVSVH